MMSQVVIGQNMAPLDMAPGTIPNVFACLEPLRLASRLRKERKCFWMDFVAVGFVVDRVS